MNYNKKLIDINNGFLVELHHNPNISSRPYFIKIFSYDGYIENRFSKEDLLKFSKSLADFVVDGPVESCYNETDNHPDEKIY
jgi:hypothetical protein